MDNNKKSNEELKEICDLINGKYIQKKGLEYIETLSKLFTLKNKNDIPFTEEEILEQPLLKDFKFEGKNDYQYICLLKASPLVIDKNKRKNEQIIAFDFVNEKAEKIFLDAKGVSYIITSIIDDNEYIIKIGQSRKTFKERLGSYNCGTVYNWRTASTTNIKILQSMVATRLVFKLYIYDCSDDEYTLIWHNIKSASFASPKSLAVEDIMIKEFIKQFKKKPLANTQVDANN